MAQAVRIYPKSMVAVVDRSVNSAPGQALGLPQLMNTHQLADDFPFRVMTEAGAHSVRWFPESHLLIVRYQYANITIVRAFRLRPRE